MPGPTDIGGIPGDGASRAVRFARISEVTITVEECVAAVQERQAGAVVTFAGVVRDHDEGRGVQGLSYSAHPAAGEAMAASADRVAAAHPEVVIAVSHRIGDLTVGDVALACAVSSAHRAAAFAACAELIDDIKATVPIWKEQAFDDGSTEWVASLG
ncbi:MAG: molybdenum cofactor biosynthesis protein MoaE [Herbiconiux sp.]|uniref:molybdenum cofactor biosynthesis protein MoaE n=1 Tax=Herbiconiux sp. TaxID=1871186 RepID=UPI001217A97A|nr:molybdenum cofactor biosynthesis protein MoaE [Herbiconiux sp.]TAJ48894.1 MAG: molybdenum cofactor biosynthesis protein MoaE [Herbiconiux sp.]